MHEDRSHEPIGVRSRWDMGTEYDASFSGVQARPVNHARITQPFPDCIDVYNMKL